MRKLSLLLFCAAFVIQLNAQTEGFGTGQVVQNDIDYNYCTLDSTANAVVLEDKGISYYEENVQGSFDVVYERYTKIKVLNSSGVKWADVEIPYYKSGNIWESVTDIKAFSYSPYKGGVEKNELNLADCYEKKVNDRWNTKRFAIPNVREGSVIEYHYKIRSQYVFSLRDWNFQWKIPVLYSEYTVKMIPFYVYSYILQGSRKFDDYSSREDSEGGFFSGVNYHNMIHKYVMKNIAAFDDEEFITTEDDYIVKVIFQLSKIIYPNGSKNDVITTWEALVKDLLSEDDYGGYIKKWKGLTPKIFNVSDMSKMTAQQKFDTVIDYVKNKYRWDGNNRLFSSKKPQKILTDNSGNSADINLMAVGLLQGVGLKADPVLISTRDHGSIKSNYPFVDFFNYSIIKVDLNDSIQFLSDATDYLLPNDKLPINCINDKGLLLNKKEPAWVILPSKVASNTKTVFLINPEKDQLHVVVQVQAKDYDGLKMRKKIGDDIDQLKSYLKEKNYDIVDSSVLIRNMKNASTPYVYVFSMNSEPEMMNDKLYIQPFMREVISENPIKKKTRQYPVDMIYVDEKQYTSVVKIPDGYRLESLPDNLRINNEQFFLDYQSSVLGNNISVSLTYRFKNPTYDAKDYLKLKKYFNYIVECGIQRVTLVKK